MRLLYFFIAFLFCQCVWTQTLQSTLVYEIIHKAQKKKDLKCSDIYLLLSSYEDSSFRNDVEMSECRSEAIIHIMYDIDNLKRLLNVIKRNKKYQFVVMEELRSPICELNEKSIVDNLQTIKGHRKLKSEMVQMLEQQNGSNF